MDKILVSLIIAIAIILGATMIAQSLSTTEYIVVHDKEFITYEERQMIIDFHERKENDVITLDTPVSPITSVPAECGLIDIDTRDYTVINQPFSCSDSEVWEAVESIKN